MSFLDDFKPNFESIVRAGEHQQLVLLECTEKSSGKMVAVVAACFVDEEGMYNLVPYARMIEGDPYEQLLSPTAEEGHA